jgi:hypothetical protein
MPRATLVSMPLKVPCAASLRTITAYPCPSQLMSPVFPSPTKGAGASRRDPSWPAPNVARPDSRGKADVLIRNSHSFTTILEVHPGDIGAPALLRFVKVAIAPSVYTPILAFIFDVDHGTAQHRHWSLVATYSTGRQAHSIAPAIRSTSTDPASSRWLQASAAPRSMLKTTTGDTHGSVD